MVRTTAALVLALLAAPEIASSQRVARAHQVAVEAGIVSLGVSYARRVGETPLSLGGGVWGSWEPAGSFERNVWEPITASLFARYAASRWVRADLGATAGRFLYADDCSECSGTLVGLRSDLYVGHRWLSIGPWATLALASDARDGSEAGVLWGVQARTIIGWDQTRNRE